MATSYTNNPNQQFVKINKEPTDDKMAKHYYAKINLKSIAYAIKTLSGSEFQVWLYFAKNQAGYAFYVSPASAKAEWGLSPSTFRKAKQALKEKGFLVDTGEGYWNFYEIPPIDLETMKVRKVDQSKEIDG